MENTGKLWSRGIAAVYTTFALATLGFVFFTTTQKVDLVSKDYYSQEVAYQKQIDRMNNAARLSEAVKCGLDDEKKFIEIKFPSDVKASGEIFLYRPSSSALDKNFPLALGAGNEQKIPAGGLAKGLWKMKLSWKSGGEEYYQEFDLFL